MASLFLEFLSNASLFAGPFVADTGADEFSYAPTMYCLDGFFEILVSLITLIWMGVEVLEAGLGLSGIWYLAFYPAYLYKLLAGLSHAINFCEQPLITVLNQGTDD